MAGLSGYNNDRIAHKPKIFIIWLFIEGFASADFIIPRGLLQLLPEDITSIFYLQKHTVFWGSLLDFGGSSSICWADTWLLMISVQGV